MACVPTASPSQPSGRAEESGCLLSVSIREGSQMLSPRTAPQDRPRRTADPLRPSRRDERREWLAIATGLVGLLAVLALVIAVVVRRHRAATTPPRRPQPAATPAAAARRRRGRGDGPDARRRQGRRLREVREGRPDAAGAGEEGRRRRLPARHAGLEGPRADRGLELRRQRQVPPRHRRLGADRRRAGHEGRVLDHQRHRQVDEGRPAALARLPLRRGRPRHAATRTSRPASRCPTRSTPSTPASSSTTAPRSRS